MKKLIPLVLALGLMLTGCGLLPQNPPDQALSDAEMASRVAELLATMTTPTEEIVFPPTATPGLPTMTSMPTATETPVVVTTEAPTEEATGDTPEAEETDTPEATATLPAGDPALALGDPDGSDPMDSYQKWIWPTDSDNYLKVTFGNGKMQMTGLTTFAGWRLPVLSQQTDSYIELTVNSGECKAKDSYGIIFRIPVFKEPEQGYLYEVTCDGYFRLWKWDGNAEIATILVNWKQSEDMQTGANQTNRMGVMVKGKTFKLYLNGVLQAEASNNSYPAGFFGVFVRSVDTAKYTVKFDEMKYWENP